MEKAIGENSFEEWSRIKPPIRASFLSNDYETWGDIFRALELGDLDYDQAAKITNVSPSMVMRLFERYRNHLMGGE